MDHQDLVTEITSRLIIGSEVLTLILIAFLIRAIIDHQGYGAQRAILTEDDRLSSAISLCAYLFAVVLGVLDSLTISSETLLAQCSEVAIKGLLMILSIEFSLILIDRLWLRGLAVREQIHQSGNVAVAIARSGAIFGISLVLSAVFEQSAPWPELMIWSGLGAGCLFVIGAAFQWLTPYDDKAELGAANIAAAWPLAGAWVAAGITAQSALIGESSGFADDLLSVATFIIVAFALIVGARQSLRSVFFRGVDLNAEITRDRNVGVALFEATLYLCVAELICFFLS